MPFMQPQSTLLYRNPALKRLQQKLHVTKTCHKKRDDDPTYAMDLPQEIGLKLTNRCNLRCTHCFQWNEEGYHNQFAQNELAKAGDLPFDVVRHLLEETRAIKSHLYVWGGEPMVYTYWRELIDLLEQDPRHTVLCTNGMFIKRELDALNRISSTLTTLVSIEGLETQHDLLRGKHTFRKVIDNVEALLAAQRRNEYKGFVSVAGVISNELVPQLFETCRFFEDLGVDSLYFNFPWYIDAPTACTMDNFFSQHFGWMEDNTATKSSWHSFDFHLHDNLMEELLEQLTAIRERTWKIRIRFQPNLEDDELSGFIQGSSKPGQRRTRCLSISNRIDLMPSGHVVPCKKFPEFKVGNMRHDDLRSVWHGEAFKRFRSIHNNTLMPICSKCELLYSNGA